MDFSVHDILPALQPYVKVIGSMEYGASQEVSVIRVLPDTCVELFINYTSVPIATIAGRAKFEAQGSFVSCRMSTFMDVQMQPGTGCIAVCFYTGVAHNFFAIPMDELADATVGLEHLWKHDAGLMEERISECTKNHQRVTIIQEYLLGLLKDNIKESKEFDYCLWQIDISQGQLRIKELMQKANISQRQLARQFNAFVGLSPKEYARVSRFICSLPKLKEKAGNNLTRIAYESGYYDQAHFIHDYKEFCGLTPGELLLANNTIH